MLLMDMSASRSEVESEIFPREAANHDARCGRCGGRVGFNRGEDRPSNAPFPLKAWPIKLLDRS